LDFLEDAIIDSRELDRDRAAVGEFAEHSSRLSLATPFGSMLLLRRWAAVGRCSHDSWTGSKGRRSAREIESFP